MKRYLTKNVYVYRILLCAIATMFFYVFNPQGLKFEYGSGGGKYVDRVDSFSEYIVRNTIKRNILSEDGIGILPIVTKGYGAGDYKYYENSYSKYQSNLAIQTIPATILAKFFNLNTENKLDSYFLILRLTNAFIFSIFVCGILLFFDILNKNNAIFLIPILAGCSTGFIYFSQNLYFASCLILLPGFFIAYQLQSQNRFNKTLIIIFSSLYFLRGYEFSTIFAMITALSAALFTEGSLVKKLGAALLAFGLICSGFIVAIFLHISVISIEMDLSFSEIIRNFYINVQHRTQSTSGVPLPFSTDFLNSMNTRSAYLAFSINPDGLKLSQLNITILLIFLFFIRLKNITNNEVLIYLYGFFGYVSWYIFAYQHIMWHPMYDWYIFALTMGFSFSLLILYYTSLFIDFFRNNFTGVRNG